MSCEVANSPFSDHGFPNPFDDKPIHGDNVDLSAVADFNNSNFNGPRQDCINPQSLSNAGSPCYPHDPTFTPDFTANNYPSDLNSTPSSPYFQSIEHQFQPPFNPALLHSQSLHRRSVSEPPDGALMHHLPPSASPIFFHRDGHTLGNARGDGPAIKKVKQSRAQPYQRPMKQRPPPQSRYQLRRAYTQPTHLPPTSVPSGLMAGSPPQQHQQPQQMQMQMQPQPQMHHMGFEHMSPEPQFVSSRVCTPAPEALDPSPGPSLGASPAPMAPHMGVGGPHQMVCNGFAQQAPQAVMGHGLPAPAPPPNAVMIKMGVEELRALITEVVQKAVEGLLAADKKGADVEAVVAEGHGDDVGDEIVGAGRDTDEKGEMSGDLDGIMEE